MSKNVTLKDVISANNLIQKNLAEQLNELQVKLSQLKINIPSPSIDPQVVQSIKKLSETYKDSMQSLAKAFQSNMAPISLSLPLISIRLQQALQSVNWDQLKNGLKVRLEAYEILMERYDVELWAIDQTIFDNLELDNMEKIPFEVIEKHVEEKIGTYLDDFKKEEMYHMYIGILEQSYAAFQSGQYALASFPLFAVIEGIMASTFKEYEIDVNLKPKLRKKRNQLYVKLADYVENTEDALAINLLFFRRVFRVYEELFKPYWDEQPARINRNWIMHGTYQYEQITKQDVLKLFQLIKAAEILKEISFETEIGTGL